MGAAASPAIAHLGCDLSERRPDRLRLEPIESAGWEGLLPWQVKRVQNYLDDGLGGRVSLSGAAEQVRLSPGYFSRRFRQRFGITFMQFVARKRIDRAHELMVRSASSLSQIAIACGFTDQAHFTRTFASLTGSTPSRWRRHAIKAGSFADFDGPRQSGVTGSSWKPRV